MQRKVLEVSQRVLGPEHAETLNSMNYLANTLSEQGKHCLGSGYRPVAHLLVQMPVGGMASALQLEGNV